MTETLRVSETVAASLGLSRAVTGETLHVVSDTVTRNWQGSGIVTFVASAGHATVTGYTAQLWAYPVPGGSPVDTQSLGVPTPDGNFVITADLTSLYAGNPAGDYTVVIVATDAGGSTPSPHSSPFTLPLP